jgi:Subtilase family
LLSRVWFVALALLVAVGTSFGSLVLGPADADAAAHGEHGAPRSPRPTISLAVAGQASSEELVSASGRIANAGEKSKVVLQDREGSAWRQLAQVGGVQKRFRLSFHAPAAPGSIRLRAVLLKHGRLLAKSAIRRLEVSRAAQAQGGGAARPTGSESQQPGAAVLHAPAQTVTVGSLVDFGLPGPLTSVNSIEGSISGSEPGVNVTVEGDMATVSAAADATPAALTLSFGVVGCTEVECERHFIVEVPVAVSPLETPAGPLEEIGQPSPDRVAAATGHELADEVVITVGSPEAPGTREQAEAAAAAVNAIVVGGLEESGIYQLRWPTPPDLDTVIPILEAQGAVTSVSPASVGLYSDASVYPVAPGFDSAKWTWPYEQVHASQAWEQTTGSNVTVGVIDEGSVYSRHEDLDVSKVIGGYSPAFHATHVAGLACAKNNGVGMVGMAWGCPIVSEHWSGSFTPGVLGAMHEMAATPGVEVVNISLGYNAGGCATDKTQGEVLEHVQSEKRAFNQFLAGPEGRKVLWTFSAGNNCAPGPASPWAAVSQLPNVITVGATNDNSKLASFSNYGPGVEIAAPGGVNTNPVTNGMISSTPDYGCPSFDSCTTGIPGKFREIACRTVFVNCSTYLESRGTSMAAPVVAGIGALVRSAHPNISAGDAGACITSSAGTDGTGSTRGEDNLPAGFNGTFDYFGSTPIVNAAAAVECAPRETASSYEGSGGGDGWAVALSSSAVYNVFHHSSVLQVACHFQADASPCWDPERIADDNENDFATSGHPGLWLDQGSGRLYVFATRSADQRAGVVCIEVIEGATDPNPFCGFTALTGPEEAPPNSGISALSNGALVGSRWYAFNYVQGAGREGSRNKLLCFDVSTFAACPGQPFSVSATSGTDEDFAYPPPAVTAIGAKVIVPQRIDGSEQLACFEGNTETPCAGSWPVTPTESYASLYGAAFPLLNSSGAITGLCLPTGTNPCYSLAGAPVDTPEGMDEAIPATSGWNGASLTLGTRVYVPSGNSDQVDCYDYAEGASCANFPHFLSNLSLLYTVNADPERPRCIWVNSDGGGGQIQNFDAYTGGHCE